MDSVILVDIVDHIAVLTINRPEALNAINREVMGALNTFFSENKDNEDIYGVIITGSGSKAFVAGADIKEFENLNEEAGSALSKFGHDTYFLIEQFHVPVIAAVNGFALGGGCELAMACHMRVAGSHAKFGQPEVNLGLVPGYGGVQRLIQLIGKGRAIEMLLTADMINAEEALSLGLVNHIVEPGLEVDKAKEILTKIASKGPLAVSKVIEIVNACHHDKKGFDVEVYNFGITMASAQAKEGAAAFVEKRKANFRDK